MAAAATSVRQLLLDQFDMAWRLLAHHLEGLSDAELAWRPAGRGPHVWPEGDGWRAGWPEHEGYDLGPPSPAWIGWHMLFWWSMALDHNFGAATLEREAIAWPGSAEALRARLEALRADWRGRLEALDEAGADRSRWPFADRPLPDLAAWLNLELMKAAAELGYARFLYAARED